MVELIRGSVARKKTDHSTDRKVNSVKSDFIESGQNENCVARRESDETKCCTGSQTDFQNVSKSMETTIWIESCDDRKATKYIGKCIARYRRRENRSSSNSEIFER